MGYRPEEFTTAFAKAAEVHPFINVTTAELFLCNFDKRIKENNLRKSPKKEPYGIQIRHALNDSNIQGKILRKAYGSIVGYLYGKHGNFVSKKYRAQPELRPAIPRYPKQSTETRIIEKPNGQLSWEF